LVMFGPVEEKPRMGEFQTVPPQYYHLVTNLPTRVFRVEKN